MKNLKIILLPFFIIAISLFSFAQKDSSFKKTDSLNQVVMQQFSQKLKTIELQRIQDSIKKSELVHQLTLLKTTDNLKKEELQEKLTALNQSELNRLADKKAKIDSMRSNAKGFPVFGFFNDTLFVIYSKLGSFSAYERAQAISNRIKKIRSDRNFKAENLQIIPSELALDITYGEITLMTVSENDALWSNKNKTELAANYKQIISNAIISYKQETGLINILKEIGLALLVLLILYFLLRNTLKLSLWLADKIKSQEGKLFNGFKIRNYSLFDSGKQINFLLGMLSIFKWAVYIILIYIALPILFGIFPWTKNFASTLFGFILNPLKSILNSIWSYLPDLFTIIIVVILFRYIIKAIQFLKKEIESGALKIPGFYPDWANPTFQIIKVLVYAFMLIVIFPYLPGSDSPVFQGVSVFLGVLFTFGSSGSLSNIIAGLVLTYMRAFKIGDRVKIGDITGDIIEKTLLVTRIRTIKNEIISIPNSNVMGSHTINYSSDATDKGLIVHSTVTIGYDVPWKTIHQALLNAAGRTEMLLKEPPAFVLQTSLDDFYVSYQINAYTKEPNKQAVIYSYLHQNIQDCCNEMGIEILSPHYRAARDGNHVTIPSDYLSKDYKAPAFKINVEKDGTQ